MDDLFPGFHDVDVDCGEVTVHARVGGSGEPLLLLHGYPQTHVMWHRVAPRLAERRTVVVADLRGYGDSGKPAPTDDHAAYAKRAMAADQVALMAALGFDRFDAAGHDRGGRVLHRMCLDHPQAVRRAAVLDIAPTRHVFTHADRALAYSYYHWFLLAQPADLPERLIGADPVYWLDQLLAAWGRDGETLHPDAVAEYRRCFADPSCVAATCEDYRAAGTVDMVHDDADADAGRRVTCPLLVLWGAAGFVGATYDVLETWRPYADDLSGGPLPGGHLLVEEHPDDVTAALLDWFGP